MTKKKLSLWLCLLIAVLCTVCTFTITFFAMSRGGGNRGGETADLYKVAVADAVFADEDEIFPLVELTENSDMATVKEGKVLLLSWHRSPQTYIADQVITVKDSGIWAFTDKEIVSWYGENSDGVTDWTLRFEQLIGLPQNNGYTHFSGFWVSLEDVVRPAYQTDIAGQMNSGLLDGSALGVYEDWFNENILWSYFESAYPWTRLGYTYDWADNGTEYGLSEFLILGEAAAEVAFTYTTEEFIAYLEASQNENSL